MKGHRQYYVLNSNPSAGDILDFIQLKEEIFFLAMGEELAANRDLAKLIRKIRSLSADTPGYKSVGLKRQIAGWL